MKRQAAPSETEGRQAFLLKLSDALRPLCDPVEIQEAAMKLLGEQFDVMRATYFEVEPDQDTFVLTARYERSAAPIPERMRLSDFATDMSDAYRSGQTLVLRDTEAEARTEAQRAAYRAIGIRAWTAVPLVKDGQLLAIVGVHSAKPRDWKKAELRLLEDVAERTWATVEQARAETALRVSEERYRTLFTSVGQGYCIVEVKFDELDYAVDYRFVEINPAFKRQTGLENAEGRWMRELAPAHEEHWFAKYGHVALTGEPVQFEDRAKELGNRWFRVNAFRVGNAEARRVAVLFEDLSERKLAEDALRESEERLSQFGDASQDVLWIRDAETLQWLYLTPAFEEIYGLRREEALTGNNYRSWIDLIVPEDRQHAAASIARVRAGEPVAFEFRIITPRDGAVRWLRNSDFPMRNAKGEIDRIGGVGHDITALKQAEEHQKFLLSELQHRVRNTLSVIRAIARRSAETSETVEELGMHLDGRIAAFARVQAAVTRDPMAGLDLATLIADTLLASSAREGPQLSIEGPPIQLVPKAAETIGLALHELTTNALKYGALSVPEGKIAIRWTVNKPPSDDRPQLVLEWLESGITLNDTEPKRSGFGTELLTHSLAYDLSAVVEHEFRRSGARYSIRIPLTPQIVKF